MNSLILSAGLDTNGQNARYVQASERWGDDPSVLKALALGKYDPAAVVARFARAADHVGGLVIRSAHYSTHQYQSMPADIVWNRATEPLVRDLAREADVWHLNNSWRPLQKLQNQGLRESRPMLLHHHGSLLRVDPKHMLLWARQRRAVQAVSTIDLIRHGPSVMHWLPTAYDIDGLQSFGAEHGRTDSGPVRIVSAPTNRALKSTDLLESTVASLQREGLDVELVVVEGRPWKDCMRIKATADIYFDQIATGGYPGGYGCNAVEAWGMGIPVMAGADGWTTARMTETWGSLPFFPTSVETLRDDLVELVTTKRLRTKWAKTGLAHARKYHDERPALRRLADLYALALEQRPDASVPLPPARFTALVPQVAISSRYINFPYETDNEHMANKIRSHAVRFPKYGIEEQAP